MENAADALKTAAFILIFVTALSITINAFGQARESIDSIVTNIDRETITEYYEQSNSTQRRVGVESIVPAIYRSIFFNFKIVFSDKITNNGINDEWKYVLYTKINSFREEEPVNYIDLETGASLSNDTKELFISYILYGDNQKTRDDFQNRTNISDEQLNIIDSTIHQSNAFDSNGLGLYEKIKDKLFEEKLGIYDPGEKEGGNDSPNVNKTEKRVITYKEVN